MRVSLRSDRHHGTMAPRQHTFLSQVLKLEGSKPMSCPSRWQGACCLSVYKCLFAVQDMLFHFFDRWLDIGWSCCLSLTQDSRDLTLVSTGFAFDAGLAIGLFVAWHQGCRLTLPLVLLKLKESPLTIEVGRVELRPASHWPQCWWENRGPQDYWAAGAFGARPRQSELHGTDVPSKGLNSGAVWHTNTWWRSAES